MNFDPTRFTVESLRETCSRAFDIARASVSVEDLRLDLTQLAHQAEYEAQDTFELRSQGSIIRVRDCARTLFRILTRRSDHLAAFSVVQAIWDIAKGVPRPDLTPAFLRNCNISCLVCRARARKCHWPTAILPLASFRGAKPPLNALNSWTHSRRPCKNVWIGT